MLLKKGIPPETVLKIVSKQLKKTQDVKGFMVRVGNKKIPLTFDEVVAFIDKLSVEIENGDYGVIRRCDTCGNFSRSGKGKSRGWCYPKDYSAFRNGGDYCSRWTPMTNEQKHIKERVNEYFESSQTK